MPGTPDLWEYDAREVSRRFLDDAAKFDAAQLLGRFAGPTLILHPERDAHVPLSHAEDLFRASRATAIREKTAREFSLAAMVERYLELYRELLSE